MGSDLRNDELTPYPDENDDRDWDFDELWVDSYWDIRASLCEHFNAILKQWHSDNAAGPEDVHYVLSLPLQILSITTERKSASAANAQALERMRHWKPPAVSPAGWHFEEVDMVRKYDEKCPAVEHLKSELMEIREQVLWQRIVQSELCDDQVSSFRFEVDASLYEHSKAIERHLVQFALQLPMDQAKLDH